MNNQDENTQLLDNIVEDEAPKKMLTQEEAQHAIRKRLSQKDKQHQKEIDEYKKQIENLKNQRMANIEEAETMPQQQSQPTQTIDPTAIGQAVANSMQQYDQQQKQAAQQEQQKMMQQKLLGKLQDAINADPEFSDLFEKQRKAGKLQMEDNVAMDLANRISDPKKLANAMKTIMGNQNVYDKMRLAILDQNYPAWVKNFLERDNPPANTTVMESVPDLNTSQSFQSAKGFAHDYVKLLTQDKFKRK